MEKLSIYSLAYKGLKQGLHKLEFDLDKAFFDNFEHSAIHDSKIHVSIDLEVSNRLLDFTYHIQGFHTSECDRCLETIHPKVFGEYRYLVKIVDEKPEHTEDEDDVAYITINEPVYNIAKDIYDFVHLSLPIRNVCEEESDCDLRVQNLLSNYHQKNQAVDPRWEKLNTLKPKKKK